MLSPSRTLIALGILARRSEILGLLGELPAARMVSHEEAITLVGKRALFRRGVGWVDAHLIASALVEHCRLWTRDRRLAAVAEDLNVAWARFV